MLLQQLFCIFLLIEQIKYLTLCIVGGRVERKSASSGKLDLSECISKLNYGAVKRFLVSNSCYILEIKLLKNCYSSYFFPLHRISVKALKP